MRRPLTTPIASLLVAGLLLTGCSSSGDDTADAATSDRSGEASGEPIRIGFEGPLSGNLAFIGSNQLAGLEASIEWINDHGGVDGRPIEVLSEDDAGDSAKAVAAVRSLAGKDVVAIMANPVSSTLEALVPVAEASGVTLISAGSSEQLLVPTNEWFYGLDIPPAAESTTQVEFAAELLGDTDVDLALIGADTPATEEWANYVSSIAEDQGSEITGVQKVPVAAADVTAQSQAVIAGEPDAILANLPEAGLALVATRVRELGYDGPVINYHGGGAPSFLEEQNDPELYVARTTAALTDDTDGKPGLQQFIDATEAAGTTSNAENNLLYGIGYLAGLVIKSALESAGGDISAAAVNAALASFELDTEGFTFGPVTYSDDDHQGLDAEVFYHWKDGELAQALEGTSFVGTLPIAGR